LPQVSPELVLLFVLPPPLAGLDGRCTLWKDFAGPDNERGDLFAGASHLLFSELQLLRGNFAEAEIYLHAAIRNARGAGNPGVWITACCTLARLRCLLGDTQGASALISDAHRALEREGSSRLNATLDLCAYSIAMLEGHPEHAEPWLMDEAEAAHRLYAPARRELAFLRRINLLFEHRYAEYISYCMEEEAALEAMGLIPRLVRKLGLAYAYDRAGLQESALTALRGVLDDAEPEGLYTPFLPLRQWMRSLPGALEDARCAPALRIIDQLCEHSRYQAPEPNAPEPAEAAGQALTRREAEIVQCLREGASNRQIAQRLYISENTVKTILKKLFAKLSISSRYDLMRTPGGENR
jgi:LuxR family maltose regulon positive regulatory protein